MSKVYKGQPVQLEGSNCGEYPAITKASYDSSLNLEYISDCKVGISDSERRHFIEKLYYDATMSWIGSKIAQNEINANATEVSITVSNSYIHITLSTDNGDFTEVNTGDSIFLSTPTQSIHNYPVIKVSNTELKVKKCDSLDSITDENNTAISVTDLKCKLNHELTKDFNKRRWDYRERYTYL